MGLREQKVEATRRAIMSAAYELFAIEGFDATTVEDAAERAVVAPRTIHRHCTLNEPLYHGDLWELESGRGTTHRRDEIDLVVESAKTIDSFGHRP